MKKQSILCRCLCLTVVFLTVVFLTVACSTPNQAGEPADATEQQDSLRPFEPDVGGDTAQTPDAGADVVEDSASSDIQALDGAADKDVGDASGGEDTVNGDAGSADAGPIDPGPPCGQVTFSFQPGGSPQQVLLSGNFNGWASSADKASVLLDDDGDGVWEVTVVLAPGKWQYKFIVDGQWIADPNNPEKIDDGFGGSNSVLTIDPCPRALALDSYDVQGPDLNATFSTPAGPIAKSAVSVTIDHAKASGLSWAQGKLKLKLSGLSPGIHDVRVHYDGAKGQDMWLLKVYVGLSKDWRDATIYFVMTDRFVNGDKTNDAPVAGVDPATNFAGGDFKGVTAKIKSGYFKALGVGALWLSWPVQQPAGAEDGTFPDGTGCGMGPTNTKYSPMKYTGYHGYWPVDTTKTEPRFGSMDELKELVNAAHAQGIRVLLDYTANHVHSASPWFITNKDKGWFHMPAEVCQDVGWENKPVTCWFTSYLADLDYDNPAVIEASLDSAFWWAKEVGADGFRLDAVKHIEMAFVKALRSRAQQEMELTGIDFYIVGETFTGDAQAIQAFVGGDKIHAQFDFPANMQLLKGFAKQEIGLDTMDGIIRGIRGVYDDQGAMMSTFIGNHDMARFISHASGSLPCGVWDIISNQAAGWKNPPKVPTDVDAYERLRLAFTYLFTTPGIPLIYYGDEFGLPGAGDPDNRRMMRFGAELTTFESETLAWLKKLGALRAAHPALRTGAWSQPLWKEGDFLSWSRSAGADLAVVMIHRGGQTKKGTLTVSAIADGTQLTEWFTGAKATVNGGKLDFELPARSAQVWVTPAP